MCTNPSNDILSPATYLIESDGIGYLIKNYLFYKTEIAEIKLLSNIKEQNVHKYIENFFLRTIIK